MVQPQKLQEYFNKFKTLDTVKPNITIVIGGDGFMLQTLKKNKNLKKIFYGINSGNYGFLMNKFSSKNIIKNLLNANMISIFPLEMVPSARLELALHKWQGF